MPQRTPLSGGLGSYRDESCPTCRPEAWRAHPSSAGTSSTPLVVANLAPSLGRPRPACRTKGGMAVSSRYPTARERWLCP